MLSWSLEGIFRIVQVVKFSGIWTNGGMRPRPKSLGDIFKIWRWLLDLVINKLDMRGWQLFEFIIQAVLVQWKDIQPKYATWEPFTILQWFPYMQPWRKRFFWWVMGEGMLGSNHFFSTLTIHRSTFLMYGVVFS